MKTLLAFLAAAAMIIVGVPAAHADEASYVADMDAAGFTNGDGTKAEVAVGMGICSELLAGDTSEHQAQQLFEQSKMTSMDEARKFVKIAIADLCP